MRAVRDARQSPPSEKKPIGKLVTPPFDTEVYVVKGQNEVFSAVFKFDMIQSQVFEFHLLDLARS